MHFPLTGPVWETFLCAELRKRTGVANAPVDLWFYRGQRAREVDFIIETGGVLSFVETK